MPKRTYGQYCALARALDVVGDRWTLLMVRELLFGPKRYTDLLDALPGIGTSLLIERLRHLEADGLVGRRRLPPPAGSHVYELTAVGAALGDALLPLALWGARHLLGARRPGEDFRAEWPLLALRGMVDPAAADGINQEVEFHIEDSIAHLRIANGLVSVHPGPTLDAPEVTVTLDLETFVAVGSGRLDLAEAIATGHMTVDGAPESIDALVTLLSTAVSMARDRPLSPPGSSAIARESPQTRRR